MSNNDLVKKIKDVELHRFNLDHDSKGNLYYLTVDDSRKPSLSLKHLNKLRKIRAIKRLEAVERQRRLELMYGKNDENEGGGGMGF